MTKKGDIFKNSEKYTLNEAMQMFFEYFQNKDRIYSNIAKVVSVSESEKTCSVEIINGEDLDDVRLQQVSSSTGLLIKPAVNSIVIINWTDKTTAYVAMFSQIDEVLFQDGTNGGLIKISDLVSRLNDLEGLFTTLQNDFNTWVVVPTDGGLALKTLITSSFGIASIPNSQDSDFENVKFKH